MNLGKGHSDYMPPSVVTEALKQVAYSSNPSLHQYTRSSVSLHLIALVKAIDVKKRFYVFLSHFYVLTFFLILPTFFFYVVFIFCLIHVDLQDRV